MMANQMKKLTVTPQQFKRIKELEAELQVLPWSDSMWLDGLSEIMGFSFKSLVVNHGWYGPVELVVDWNAVPLPQ